MRIRERTVKVIDPSMKLAIGTVEELAGGTDGKRVVIETIEYLPYLTQGMVTVERKAEEVLITLLEMCLRKSLSIRDSMGNVHDDFGGWCYVQAKAISLITGEFVEDVVNKLWYGTEKLLSDVLCIMPYYSLRMIHYSVTTREIIFTGDYGRIVTPCVTFVNYDFMLQTDSIVNKAFFINSLEYDKAF